MLLTTRAGISHCATGCMQTAAAPMAATAEDVEIKTKSPTPKMSGGKTFWFVSVQHNKHFRGTSDRKLGTVLTF